VLLLFVHSELSKRSVQRILLTVVAALNPTLLTVALPLALHHVRVCYLQKQLEEAQAQQLAGLT
jgi:hypothetical protein